MSHILEVVVAAFLVGLAGALAGFLLEKRAHAWISQGKSGLIRLLVSGLLAAAILVVVAGFYADSLNFQFARKTINIVIPNPQLTGSNRHVSLLLVLGVAATFFLGILGESIAKLSSLAEKQSFIQSLTQEFSGTVTTASKAVTVVLLFQYLRVRLYFGQASNPLLFRLLALFVVNYVLGQIGASFALRALKPRVAVAATIVWFALTYTILTVSFIS